MMLALEMWGTAVAVVAAFYALLWLVEHQS